MSNDAAAISAEARSWVGTPIGAGRREKGVAVDSWGLVRAVGEACELFDANPQLWASFAMAGGDEDVARAWLDTFMVRLGRRKPREGDVCLLRVSHDGPATQMAILTSLQGRPYLVHALDMPGRVLATGARRGGVVEHGFRPPWPQRVVKAGWYRFPGIG